MKKTALILFLALLFFSPGRLTSFDAGVRLEMGHALWQTASVFIPITDANRHYLIPHPTNRLLGSTFHGVGQGLLFIPFSWLAHMMGPGPVAQTVVLAFLYGPLMGLLFWFAMAGMLARLGFAKRVSELSASLILFGTTALIYSVGILQEEIPIAILFCWGTSFGLDYLKSASPKQAFLSVLCLASTGLFRTNVIFAALPVALLLFDNLKAQRKPLSLNRPALAAAGFALPITIKMLILVKRFKIRH